VTVASSIDYGHKSYLPFEWLLPKVDVCVTNGGYGGVNRALSFGIPSSPPG
jgi:UDP:flavonoid glycosyltransferase YjiC (YdhE family)